MTTQTRIRGLLTFDRHDFAATRTLLLVIAIGTPAITALWPVVDWLRGLPLAWQVSTETRADAASTFTTTAGTTAQWNGEVLVTLAHASTAARLATLLPGLVVSTAVVVIALRLLSLLRAIQAGEPFATTSVRSLRVIALVLFITPLLAITAEAVAGGVVSNEAFADAPFAFAFSLGGVLVAFGAGLLVAALAEAFAHGAQLRADVDGLV